MAAVIATGSGLGIVLAGPIVGALDWRWLFWLPMTVVGIVAVFAYRLVPASPVRTAGRINWLAAALLSGWLVALLLLSKAINLIVQSVPRHQTGVASGMNTNVRTIGASIGTAAVSSIVTSHVTPGGLPAEAGFTESFLVLAAIAAAAFVVAMLVPAAPHPAPAPAAEATPELTAAEA
jgi:sugar phosphate permease